MPQRTLPLLRSMVPLPVRRWIPLLIPASAWEYLWGEYLASGRPDRRYLTERILPTMAGAGFRRALFVGCRRYTRTYGEPLKAGGVDYWTTDVDPDAARWGEEGRHVTCDVQEVDRHVPVEPFDLVLLNGVFGDGVDTTEAMSRTVRSVGRILEPGGVLLLGWNSDRIADPLPLDDLRRLFRHGSRLPFPARVAFEEGTHVYDFLTRYPEASGRE